MFPDNFYPYGAVLATAALALMLLPLFIKWPKHWLFDWRTVLTILLAGNILDYFSTWLFVSTQGINAESNYIARELMRLGWGWFTLYKLVFLNVISTIWVVVIAKRAPVFSTLLLALGTMLVLVAIHNVVAYLRF